MKLPSATPLPRHRSSPRSARDRVALDALQRKLTGDLVLVAAQVPGSRSTQNARPGNFAASNHSRPLTSFSESSLARSTLLIDVELGPGFRHVLRQERDIGLPLPESAFDVDTHLARHEADFALVDQHARRRRRIRAERTAPTRALVRVRIGIGPIPTLLPGTLRRREYSHATPRRATGRARR